ncbi:Leucine-rich repeat receptor protein kinase ems1 [Thalictrum thalictroides]|uniref:non-specific serine/threonine protein kinase n=1 Tax=Thalictrum thalictroides TaxID=46969 RepID=A0A7J6UVG3_THATH|nr:Leucine-rich repeat receptor protein kinase ems1 [Thalictrum thalictroides]
MRAKLLLLISCLLSLHSLTCFGLNSTNPKLVSDEVNVLKVIGAKLGKKDWDFNVDPCSGERNWNPSEQLKGFENIVECDCSFKNNSTCHVIKIWLKAQNLSGTLPPELSKLRFLKSLDLSRNILSGSVPSKWATTRLEDLSFMGNRLSGPFPKTLLSITTLRNLSIEGNRFTGALPLELGKLISLEKLVISSNQFTGELPKTLGSVVNLTDLRISDNNFSGRIPDFIGNWTNMEKLHIQGSSLEGPIPATISALTSLTDLRISDLTRRGSGFPPLSKMKSMKILILRKCLNNGNIPEYIGEDMEKLKTLDLSFNNLTGKIPASFDGLDRVDFMDVSSNNFTWDSKFGAEECSGGTRNLVESYLPTKNEIHPCLKKSFPCESKKIYSLHINCGGNEILVNGTKYEADREPRGSSTFYYAPKHNWAFGSTGNFMDNDMDADDYIKTNDSAITSVSIGNSDLYRSARLSPLSLTYYGLCLGKGNYTVKLHFAELFFHNDSTFRSLGKHFKPPAIKKTPTGLIIGVSASALFLILVILCILWKKGCLGNKDSMDKDLRSLDLKTGLFSLRQIKAATNNFDLQNKLGEGGFGAVYKAIVLQERGSLLEMVDPNLGSEFSTEEAMVMLNVSLLCTSASPTLRPTMSQVVSMLEGKTPIQDLLSDPGFSTIDSRVKAIRNHFWQVHSETETQSMLTDGPYTHSSNTNGEESGNLNSTNGPYSVPSTGTEESEQRFGVSPLESTR